MGKANGFPVGMGTHNIKFQTGWDPFLWVLLQVFWLSEFIIAFVQAIVALQLLVELQICESPLTCPQLHNNNIPDSVELIHLLLYYLALMPTDFHFFPRKTDWNALHNSIRYKQSINAFEKTFHKLPGTPADWWWAVPCSSKRMHRWIFTENWKRN